MNDDVEPVDPVDLSPTRAELLARVRARGRQIRARRRAGISALAALVVVAIAVPAIALGSRSSSDTITPATVAPRRGDFRMAIVLRAERDTRNSCADLSDGTYCYVLGRTLVTAADVRGAKVVHDSVAGWAIEVTLSASGLHRLTSGTPGHQAAIIVAGKVISAPTIVAGITSPIVEVASPTGLSEVQAEELADAILGRSGTRAAAVVPGDLSVAVQIDDPDENAPACTLPAAGRTCLPLGPTLVDAKSVLDVAVFYGEDSGIWGLRITFTPAAAHILAAQAPHEVAFVVGGRVQATSSMPEGLSGNEVAIEPYIDRAGLIMIATQILGHAPAHVEYRTLTANIALDNDALPTGTSRPGELVVYNYSSEPVRMRTDAEGCRLPWTVELVNASVPLGPSPERTDCQAPLILPPGENRIPFTLLTRYRSCTEQPVGNEVACLPDGGLPPLPPGDYTAVLAPLGLFPASAPVRVPLVAANP